MCRIRKAVTVAGRAQRTMQEQEENRSKKYDDLPGGTRTRRIARYIRTNTVALALIFQRTVGALCT
jgi:hypothetical protein